MELKRFGSIPNNGQNIISRKIFKISPFYCPETLALSL